MRLDCAYDPMNVPVAPAAASIATITASRAGERAAARHILTTRAWTALGSTSR
jgi:hypothetical protein